MAILVKKQYKDRLIQELYDLKEENKPLFNLLIDLRGYIKREFNKNLVLTHIYRLQEEQDHFYKDNARYKKRKFKSPHQFWHALDLSTKLYTEEEIKQIENYLNNKYKNSNFYSWTAKNHNVGFGDHFHVQYYYIGNKNVKI